MPFKVRDAKVINDGLGFMALPEDFNAVAIVEFNNGDINDDASTSGCPFINIESGIFASEPNRWTQYDPYREEITPEIELS